MTERGAVDPLVVFDLRNGRVGGLTFCRIVETWFYAEQSWMIDNDTSVAVAQWRDMPEARRRGLRFIWGHEFSSFRKRVGLERPVRIVGLVRHPLLKISGSDVRCPEQLNVLDKLSLESEFSVYREEGGVLPCGSPEAFLTGHFVLGVTELMEESLLLLRARLGVEAPLTPWDRIGSQANLADNIYSHGLVKAFVERPQYKREMGYYRQARERLTHEVRQLDRRHLTELARYKAECGGRDPTLQKWATAFPDVFKPSVPTRRWNRPRRPQWLRPQLAASRIQCEVKHWMVILGRGEAELARGDGVLPEERDVLSPMLTIRLYHLAAAEPPNLLRIELILPAVDQPGRWIYGMLGEHKLFQVEVGSGEGVHGFEVPVSPRLDRVTLLINQYQDVGGRRLYARLGRLLAVSAPLKGLA